MLNYAHQFIKITLVFHTPISETKPVTPNFYFISETSKSLSVRSRSLYVSVPSRDVLFVCVGKRFLLAKKVMLPK